MSPGVRVSEPDAAAVMVRELGRQLAGLRRAAGLTQHQLAGLTGFSGPAVSLAEIGRQSHARQFWEACDKALDTDGVLTAGFDQITVVREAQQQARARAAQEAREARALAALTAAQHQATLLPGSPRFSRARGVSTRSRCSAPLSPARRPQLALPEHLEGHKMPGDGHTSNCRADPVRADCPVSCLAAFLSAKAFIPLHRAYLASYEPPRTVGDVVQLLQQGKLAEIRGLGPRRIGEIELCLTLAGLLLGQPTGHQTSMHCDPKDGIPNVTAWNDPDRAFA